MKRLPPLTKKRRLAALLALAAAFALFGSLDSADRGRGSSQFSFTTDDRGGAPGLGKDSNAARFKEQQAAHGSMDGGTSLPPPETGASQRPSAADNRQQAGEAPPRSTTTLDEEDPYRRQDGSTALRHGRSAGQTSNVPGTTTTSPNGTSSVFGTEGLPVFQDDLKGDLKDHPRRRASK